MNAMAGIPLPNHAEMTVPAGADCRSLAAQPMGTDRDELRDMRITRAGFFAETQNSFHLTDGALVCQEHLPCSRSS
jgi:hypothetical protein